MARVGAVAALLVLALLVASTAAALEPKCCTDYHEWGAPNQITGCPPEKNSSCDAWCQASCRGGECKLRGNRHMCHCFC
ncbi:hypothetical protein ACP70R_044395 [Stipagrostis hirtigluma subsp. patula]